MNLRELLSVRANLDKTHIRQRWGCNCRCRVGKESLLFNFYAMTVKSINVSFKKKISLNGI